MEVREYIIEEADKLFCQYGFKSVTMDDIAKHLGMSKKTIYQNFSDKDELVTILIKEKLAAQNCLMEDAHEKAEDAIEEIYISINNIHEVLNNINPKLFYDLQKYHTQAWLFFKEFRDKAIYERINNNLKRGVKEGLYRADINIEIMTQLRLDQSDLIFHQHEQYTMNKYNIAQVMVELTEHFLYGVCSLTGLGHIYANKMKLQTQNTPTEINN